MTAKIMNPGQVSSGSAKAKHFIGEDKETSTGLAFKGRPDELCPVATMAVSNGFASA